MLCLACIILIILFVGYMDTKGNYHDAESVIFYKSTPIRQPRKIIGLIGGIHGNEQSGSVALVHLIKSGWFDKQGQRYGLAFKVIPNANPWGLSRDIRYNEKGIDLNRQFTKTNLDIVKDILQFFNDCDLVVDFHEGWGWHQITPASMGSTLTANSPASNNIADQLVSAVNKTTRDLYPQEPKKQFVLLDHRVVPCEIPSTLGCFSQKAGKDHILVEITGQNNVQPMLYRTTQIYSLLNTLVSII